MKHFPVIDTRGTLIREANEPAPTGNAVLDRLQEEREDQFRFIDSTLAKVQERGTDMVEAEEENLKAARDRVKAIDKQIEPLRAFEELRAAGRKAEQSYRPTRTPAAVPDAGNGGMAAQVQARGHEYKTRGEVIADLVRGDETSLRSESGRSVNTDEFRAARERLMGAHIDFHGAPEEYRAVVHQTTSNTPGLLPKTIIGEVDNNLDAARPFINSIGARDLGSVPGKVFTRPIVTQHTTSGVQTNEKDELPSRQLIIGGVDFTKKTRGGSLNVSRQDIDWTSPSAWDAILNDLQEVYELDTENDVADAFVTAITQQTAGAVATNDLKGWAASLYEAAGLAYAGSGRMPNHIWCSLDMWGAMGSIVDSARLAMRPGNGGGESLGQSSPTSFEGAVLDLPRTVVPSFANGTIIVGVKEKTEFYEQRIGLLQAVQPSLLGVEIAYGGYYTSGTLRPLAFAKVQKFVAA